MSDGDLWLMVDSFLDRMWDDFVVGRETFSARPPKNA